MMGRYARRLWEQCLRRDAHPLVQFAKYAVCGVLATAVDVLVFYLAAVLLLPALNPGDPAARLLGLHTAAIPEGVRSAHYVWDKVIAFMFSNLTAYVANVLWVFTRGRHSKAMEFALFYAVSAASFAIGTALGWALIQWTGLPTTYAYAANAAASLAINFAARKFIVFKG
ncbi:MAG: GtrA family protein [Elusimicrobia bacterium]|nr:GtrA family protein [Elusimicrobiota bacterium]